MGRTDVVRLSLAGESGQCEGQEGKMEREWNRVAGELSDAIW